MRFQVSQAALITQPGLADIACEIRDFCLGGLFLRFVNADTAIAALVQRADAEVDVVFTPAALSTTQTFRVPATLKRLGPVGIGVAFGRQPIEALRALQKLRMASHRQKLAALPAGDAFIHLREASTTLLRETLLHTHEQAQHVLGDRLQNAALHAAGISEHSGLLSAVSEFARHAPVLQVRFIEQVMDALQHRRPVRTQPTAEHAPDGLSLVDENDFEDWLATASEASRLEEQFQEQLFDLEPRIGQLFGIACDHSNNPFGPAVIVHAYREALEGIPLLARARQVAYVTLREALAEQLAPLYAELLAMLPVSETETRQCQSEAAATQHESASPDPAEDAPAPAAADAAAVAPTRPRSTLGRLASSLFDFFRNQPEPAAGQPMGGAQSMSAPAQAPRTQVAGAPSAGAASAMAHTAARAGLSGGSPVLERLARSGALPPTLTQEMQRSVDMFGALFDTMHAEKSVSAGVRPLFQQLESSLARLALSDPQFLVSASHPAHKVLNTLDRLSMIADDDGRITDQRLLALMQRWTDRINTEAEKNPAVFEEARIQLERVIKPLMHERTGRIFRLQEVCEGRQRADVVKHSILNDLLTRLGERPAPNAVIELLNGGWRNVLLMADLRYGSDSETARSAWEVLEQLCARLDPDQPAATTAQAQTLLQRIDEALTSVCADKLVQDRIIDQLATALFDDDRSRHPRTSVAARLNDAADEPLTTAQDELAERLRVGDWLQFKSPDTPLNLIWIGDQPPVYVFANYRGIKKLDLKRQDLLQALENGDAQWTADLELPLMDRSYSAMVQKMQRELLWRSTHDTTTGLLKRRSFFRAVRRHWLRSRRADAGFALGVIQLDITTPAGEPAGAEIRSAILHDLAQWLPASLSPGTPLARAGESGLAFWIEASGYTVAEAQTHALLQAIAARPHEIDGVRYKVGTAAGLMGVHDALDPEGYYDNANAACTRARESGNAVVAFDRDTADSGVQTLAEQAHLLTAILANNELSLNCQPVVGIGDTAGTPLYHEVLLHPDTRGAQHIATRDLIAVAERIQRITEIDRWVVKSVLQWMREHPERTAQLGGLSVNLSAQSITNPVFLKFLLAELARGDIPGDKLVFEISEIDAAEGHAQTQLFMRQLQRHGCRFTLDEFGTGASSYTRLKSMKLDFLKIDQALVRELGTSMIDQALVQSILETGNFLGVKTVAAFVEDAETLAKLAEMGIDCVQGYFIGAPRPLESLA